MNNPVGFYTSKLLKEKGFDEECRLCVEDGDERPLPFNCGKTIHRNSLHPNCTHGKSNPEEFEEFCRISKELWAVEIDKKQIFFK